MNQATLPVPLDRTLIGADHKPLVPFLADFFLGRLAVLRGRSSWPFFDVDLSGSTLRQG